MEGILRLPFSDKADYEFFVNFSKYPRNFVRKMSCIVKGYFLTVRR